MARYIDIKDAYKVIDRFLGYLDEEMIYRIKFKLNQDCPTADVVPKSVASEIIDEIIDALQGEKDAEEKLGGNAWDTSDTVGYHIHQYAEEKLDTIIIALALYKREYTQDQNIGKTITVPKYKYTGN